MAPPSNSQLMDRMDSILKQQAELLKQNSDMIAMMRQTQDQLTTIVTSLSGKLDSIYIQLDRLVTAQPAAVDPVKAVEEYFKKKEKACNAVIVGLPEPPAGGEGRDFDVVQSVCDKAGIDTTNFEVRRFGRLVEGRNRITKVYTQSTSARAALLTAFRTYRPANLPRGCFCRPDMTTTEREADYAARQECRRRNDEEANGDKKYIVRNSKVIVNRNYQEN